MDYCHLVIPKNLKGIMWTWYFLCYASTVNVCNGKAVMKKILSGLPLHFCTNRGGLHSVPCCECALADRH